MAKLNVKEINFYKETDKPLIGTPDSVYFIMTPQNTINLYVSDAVGNLIPLSSITNLTTIVTDIVNNLPLLEDVMEGTGVTIDKTNPRKPIISCNCGGTPIEIIYTDNTTYFTDNITIYTDN